jgi:hypothetical protein
MSQWEESGMERSFKNYAIVTTLRCCVLVFLALVFTVAGIGCAQVNHLREAQDAFNQAAHTENALRFNPVPNSDVASLSAAARTGYASVLVSLDRLDPQEINRLKGDKLWGNVLALKALSQWRLRLYPQAKQTAAAALQLPVDALHPRDRTLMAALPALIRIDQVHHFISLGEGIENEEISKNDFDANISSPLLYASTILDEARRLAAPDEPIQIYLIQAQLAAYRNLKIGYRKFSPEGRDSVPVAMKNEAQDRLQDLSDVLLATIGSGDERSNLLLYWYKLIGLYAPDNRCQKREICGG